MILELSRQKIVGIFVGMNVEIDQGFRYSERKSRECLDLMSGFDVWQRSRDRISEEIYALLLKLSRQVSQYTNAIEALEHLDLELNLDEFSGEF